MNFIEALNQVKYHGRTITRSRYTECARRNVQFYLDAEGNFVSQNDDEQPKVISASKESFTEEWEIYTGPYARYQDTYRAALEEFEELERELGPLHSKLRRFEVLKKELKR